MKVTGGCHCGHIKYEAEVDPATVRVCHCTDCQKLSGTAFRANIASLPGTFVLTSGTPKIYTKTAESGNQRAHAFCPECGTPIYSAAPRAEPVNVWAAGRRDRPASSIRTAVSPDLVPLGPALVDGPDARGAGRAAVKRRVGRAKDPRPRICHLIGGCNAPQPAVGSAAATAGYTRPTPLENGEVQDCISGGPLAPGDGSSAPLQFAARICCAR